MRFKRRRKPPESQTRRLEVVAPPEVSADDPEANGNPRTGQMGAADDPAAFLDKPGPP